ncbi:MAG TPA: hypothetical protein VN441_16700 [Syntrophomonas sp.]|nr:hypothetical protein [Syntrophomonas sp.]
MPKDNVTRKDEAVSVFSRNQILSSKKLDYSPNILRVVLKEDRKYSLDEVDDLVQAFKERVI